MLLDSHDEACTGNLYLLQRCVGDPMWLQQHRPCACSELQPLPAADTDATIDCTLWVYMGNVAPCWLCHSSHADHGCLRFVRCFFLTTRSLPGPGSVAKEPIIACSCCRSKGATPPSMEASRSVALLTADPKPWLFATPKQCQADSPAGSERGVCSRSC